jgi:hypothetical protein
MPESSTLLLLAAGAIRLAAAFGLQGMLIGTPPQ